MVDTALEDSDPTPKVGQSRLPESRSDRQINYVVTTFS